MADKGKKPMQEEEATFSFQEKNGDHSHVSRAFTSSAFGALSSEPRNLGQGLLLGGFPISGLRPNMHFPSHGLGSGEGGSSSESIVGDKTEEADNQGQGVNSLADLPPPPAPKTAWQALQESSKRRREYKKSLTPVQLEELAKHKPEHAERILSNRNSAIDPKRKKQYESCRLQRELGALRAQSNKLSSSFDELQESTYSLEAEKKNLIERMKEVEHNIHLQEMLNESLRKDLELEYMVKIPTPNFIASPMSLSGQQLAGSREAAGTSGTTPWSETR